MWMSHLPNKPGHSWGTEMNPSTLLQFHPSRSSQRMLASWWLAPSALWHSLSQPASQPLWLLSHLATGCFSRHRGIPTPRDVMVEDRAYEDSLMAGLAEGHSPALLARSTKANSQSQCWLV